MAQIKFVKYFTKMGGKVFECFGIVRGVVTLGLVVVAFTPTVIGAGIFVTNKIKELFFENTDDYGLGCDKENNLEVDEVKVFVNKEFKKDKIKERLMSNQKPLKVELLPETINKEPSDEMGDKEITVQSGGECKYDWA